MANQARPTVRGCTVCGMTLHATKGHILCIGGKAHTWPWKGDKK